MGPEADSTQQKWPLDGLTCVWMTAGQCVVVEEDSSLQFKVLLEE